MTSAILSVLLLAALALHLRHIVRKSRAKADAERAELAAVIHAVVADARDASSGTAGVITFAGTWQGERVHIRTIVDTLATRKLPARWLSVTITESVRIPATFDLMMRPGSATTFSNFDHLPRTVPTPANYPEGAVIRTDGPGLGLPLDAIAAHLGVFDDRRAKELLVTENGVRIVWLLAEADRARYGVFRQAAFSGPRLDPGLIAALLTDAAALRSAINHEALRAAA